MLIIASFVILVPAIQTWIISPEQTSSVVFVFSGKNPLWHSGQLALTYEDGHIEISNLFGAYPRYDDYGEYLGLFTYVRAGRNFTKPERLEIEYLCSGLNMTVGPISFMSNYPLVLYSDASGQKIEFWTGQI